MTEKELMGLISRSVEDAFAANKEIIAAGLVVIGNNSSRYSGDQPKEKLNLK